VVLHQQHQRAHLHPMSPNRDPGSIRAKICVTASDRNRLEH